MSWSNPVAVIFPLAEFILFTSSLRAGIECPQSVGEISDDFCDTGIVHGRRHSELNGVLPSKSEEVLDFFRPESAQFSLPLPLGASQSDIAFLRSEDIDWKQGVISYQRKKTGEYALIRIDAEVECILRTLPGDGPLFPYLCTVRPGVRATEFLQRTKGLGINGVSLHSYRYAWAERARQCGYPERFAQEALGHNSKAVHRAYARKAQVVVPPLSAYESQRATDISREIRFPGPGALVQPSAEPGITFASSRSNVLG